MNKKIYSLILSLLAFTGLFSSCSDKEDIVFDHELQQFETRADRILLEFIVPFGTAPEEEIYIVGAFNGGEEAAVGDPTWKLTKAPNTNEKFGIYLDPSTFVGGATLADGFHFVSATQGQEYTIKGEVANHTDNPAVGTFTNIWGQRWESYYWQGGEKPEPARNGYRIYVDDQTGWSAIALYAWGDSELFGGWPGAAPVGTWEHNGVNWTLFDVGEGNEGLVENLIFNNNGGGVQLADFNVTLDRDLWLRVTAEGVEEIGAEPVVKHDGYAFFILNESTQTDLALYAWADGMPELFGGWPGMTPPTGAQVINGIDYIYFDLGEANTGLTYNFIVNNNNNGVQWSDLNQTIDHDIYIRLFDGGYELIDPNNPGGGGDNTDIDPEPEPGAHKIYIVNNTGWASVALYAWGTDLPELFGAWPGNSSYTTEAIGGMEALVFTYNDEGNVYNLILNDNGGGNQIDGPAITTGEDYYFEVTANGWNTLSR